MYRGTPLAAGHAPLPVPAPATAAIDLDLNEPPSSRESAFSVLAPIAVSPQRAH